MHVISLAEDVELSALGGHPKVILLLSYFVFVFSFYQSIGIDEEIQEKAKIKENFDMHQHA